MLNALSEVKVAKSPKSRKATNILIGSIDDSSNINIYKSSPLSKDAIAVILQDLFTLVYPFLMNSNIMSRLPNIRLMSLRKIKSNEMLHPKRYFPIKKENAYTASGVAISTIKI